ncbi:MAG: hypothetical protein JW743_05295 [Deltaproteobacteria bacterium]|nr:hypothetical protein [Deltaproteobacteria bacterium]MBN2845701.1 hypothetical protein [Deltaproteobacteria bacterium]
MKKTTWLTLFLACAALVIVAAFIFHERGKVATPKEEAVKEAVEETPAIVQEKKVKPETTTVVRKKISQPVAPEETLDPGELALEKREEVKKFFAYLDRQDYIKAYALEKGTYAHFLQLLSKLSSNPPVVSGEMKDISLLMQNMAHFCRVTGKKNIVLFKDILSHEKDIIEPTTELLYEWMLAEINAESGEIELSLEGLYEYAAFFLNTIAGKAYLMRRDSKTRILSIYYSVLIIDEADRENLNRYGFDILPVINYLLDDVSTYGGLEYRDKYRERLDSLKNNLRNRAS